jgi:NB-ARC domain/TIR domain
MIRVHPSSTEESRNSASQVTAFISYARKDGIECGRRMREWLTGQGISVWQDVVSMGGGEDWWQQIAEAIEGVRAMVLVITPTAMHSPVVRREWIHARQVGTQILPVTFDVDIFRSAAIPPRWLSRTGCFVFADGDPDLEATQARLLSQLLTPSSRRPVPFMAPPLPSHFVSRLKQQELLIRRLIDERGDPRSASVALHGAPGFGKTTLAQALCYEPDVVEAFTGGILWGTFEENGTPILVSLSAMVRTLSGAPEEFGSCDEAASRLHQLLQHRDCLLVLDDVWDSTRIELFARRGGNDRSARLITTRDPGVAAMMDSEQPVFTPEMSRSEALQVLLNWCPNKYRPSARDGGQERLAALAARLGDWPLLLEIYGGTLRAEVYRSDSVNHALDWIDEGLSAEGLAAFDAARPEERNQALAFSIDASLRQFTAAEMRCLYLLSIFRAGDTIPEQTIVRLWSGEMGLRDFEARKLLRRLAHLFVFHVGLVRLHSAVRECLASRLGPAAAAAAHQKLLQSYNPDDKPWHEIPDDGYLYDHVAYHLTTMEAESQLDGLFGTQNWLRVRVRQSEYLYDGYLADLAAAWDGFAFPEMRHQIARGDEPVVFAKLIRYAIIRTSINSIAGNFPESVVAQAVEMEVWTPDRALNLAANVADPRQRIGLYVALLKTGKLNQQQQADACRLGVDAALSLAVTDAYDIFSPRAAALTALLPYLEGEEKNTAVRLALDAALAIEFLPGSTDEQLGPLAPYLEGQFLERALQSAIRMAWRPRAYALAALAPRLGVDQLRQALEAAREIGMDDNRAKALAGLVPYLCGDERATALREGLQACQLVPCCASDYTEIDRIAVLGSLIAHLNGEERAGLTQQALSRARSIRDLHDCSDALLALVPLTAGAERSRILERALNDALVNNSWALIAFHLKRLVPFLEAELVERALEAALAIKEEKYRVQALTDLAPRLSGEALSLAQRLEGVARRDLLGTALSTAMMIQDGEACLQALKVLAPYVDEGEKADILRRKLSEGLDLAPSEESLLREFEDRLADPEHLARWLAHRAVILPLHLLREALVSARAITQEWPRAYALAALAPLLTGDDRCAALRLGLDSALCIRRPEEQARALAALVPLLEGQEKAFAGKHGLRAALDIEDDSWERAYTLAALLPHLEGNAKTEAAQQALEATLSIDEHVLVFVQPILSIHEKRSIPRTLAKIAPYLDGVSLHRGLQAAEAIEDAFSRAQTLIAFLPVAPEPTRLIMRVREAMADHLAKLRVGTREQLLAFCADGKLFAPPILPPAVLKQIGDDIAEIWDEWKWI